MIKTLILGCNGLLGKEVSRNCMKREDYLIGIDIVEKPELNIFDNYIKYDLLKINDFHQIKNLFFNLFDKESDIINIIDCTLINKNKSTETIQEIQNFWHGMISLQVLLAKAAGSFCIKNKKNINLVFTSSVKAFRAPKFSHYEDLGMETQVEYGMAKAALNLLVKDTTVRYKPFLRCNAVAPGGIKGEKHNPIFLERYEESCTQKGLVNPSSVANMIELITSESSEFSGQVIVIDNGWSLL
ncbi:MAG: SDR family oxidoreductase [Prochlorococcus marinus CUG1439]|uniref:SDR family oxidoreductase n=1 Tax=Prochlorococcus sp. MIT 1314 TaxID=3096220 RepID=UPI001B03E8B3|nr:SDR family oxidoreductase [Prochlorococcus sp. MIT 1314]MCR8538796.1 SDR family oxidoreductase [Prochlorococcus marinus CUG1439]